jgi:hypothetical protein
MIENIFITFLIIGLWFYFIFSLNKKSKEYNYVYDILMRSHLCRNHLNLVTTDTMLYLGNKNLFLRSEGKDIELQFVLSKEEHQAISDVFKHRVKELKREIRIQEEKSKFQKVSGLQA